MIKENFPDVVFYSKLVEQIDESESARIEIEEKLKEAREIATDLEKELVEIEGDNEFVLAEGCKVTTRDIIDRLQQNLAEVKRQIEKMENMSETVSRQAKK
ncbi:MAG: hypothetical protein U9O20_00945 [Patescibacteria group bacterium]|nr:hypothetical protein [Patescibacteria group bacterium]